MKISIKETKRGNDDGANAPAGEAPQGKGSERRDNVRATIPNTEIVSIFHFLDESY
jgi:hypothetical protein